MDLRHTIKLRLSLRRRDDLRRDDLGFSLKLRDRQGDVLFRVQFSNASLSAGCGYATISFALLMSALPHSKVFRAGPILNGGLDEGAFRRLLRRIPLLNRSMFPARRRPGATSGYAMHRDWGSKSLAHWS
jgi:hypothetical protein